jgi:hypothetical protein
MKREIQILLKKVKLSHYAMQAPRGEEKYLLFILDLGTRGG